MKIFGDLPVEINVSEREQKRIFFDFLYKKFNWGKDFFIEDGKVFESVEYHTSHSWFGKEFRREASELDCSVAEIIKHLKKNQ